MPVREALRQLQGEGLVVLTTNRGARVRAVDIDFVRNIFHAVINDAAQNPEAAAVLDRHRRLIAALRNLHGYGDDRPPGVISDHRHITSALAAHDADVAASLAMAHAAKAKQELIARMSARDIAMASAAA